MKEINITYDELMKEIDTIQGISETHRIELTEKQITLVKKARAKNPPLSWQQILNIWNKAGWRKYRNPESLRKIFRDII